MSIIPFIGAALPLIMAIVFVVLVSTRKAVVQAG
jgi:hypothetical protein